MVFTVYDVQRDFALSSGLQSVIIWDSLSSNQSEILQDKIKTLIPDGIGNRNNAVEKMRKELFINVWKQRKFTNGNLLSAIIYVLVTEAKDPDLAAASTVFTCHPVFRTRKCLNDDNSKVCCMIFIDENARVYNNWNEYLNKNILPKGTMIAPVNGVYTFNSENDVELMYQLTPAAKPFSKIINTTDTVVAVGSVIAAAPIVAAISIPVAAPIVMAATVATVATSVYSTVRSALQLTDRHIHGQSTAITHEAARSSWIGMAGGVIGIGSVGATRALTSAAAVGNEMSMASIIAARSVNVSSIVLSGSGIVNGVYDFYLGLHNNDVNNLNVLHLASSLLIFTNSINNYRMASNVIEASRNQPTAIRSNLTNAIRGNLIELVRQITGQRNGSQSNVGDVVRIANDIPQRNALLDLHNTNQNLSVRDAVINSTSNVLFNRTRGLNSEQLLHLIMEFGPQFYYTMSNFQNFADVIAALGNYFSDSVVHLMLKLAKTFIDIFANEISRELNTHISTESILYRIFMHCITNYQNFSYNYLESKTPEIIEGLRVYFDSLKMVGSEGTRSNCSTCNGYYFS